jgi:hypothetical protein
MLLTDVESCLIAAISDCLELCHIQGVSSFGDAVQLATQKTPTQRQGVPATDGALFLFQSGERVNDQGNDCFEWFQRWTILVASKHACEYQPGRQARTANAALLFRVACCLDKIPELIRAQSPALDQPPGLGLSLSLISYDVPIHMECH